MIMPNPADTPGPRFSSPTGLAGKGFGIDNVHVSVDVVAPQVFDVGSLTSPVNVSNGVPAAGAGNLETKASQDQYLFTVTDGQSVYFDGLTCVSGSGPYLNWRMVSEATGATVKSGGCGDAQTAALPAGTYRMIVSVQSEVTGAYAFQLFAAPAPQVFNIGSLTSPVNISNGVPAAGAGNLETKASQDQYVFTVTSGQAVYVDIQTCPGTAYLNWKWSTTPPVRP